MRYLTALREAGATLFKIAKALGNGRLQTIKLDGEILARWVRVVR